MNINENIKKIIVKKPLQLDCGKTISNYPLAYETYGNLNEKKDNAILAFHALTGDQFASGTNPVTNKPGWWSHLVGPSKAINTNKFFVICANVIGGCMGSLGPSSIDPQTQKIYGTNFPVLTINDIVNAQYNLLEFFKIEKLYSVLGGSMLEGPKEPIHPPITFVQITKNLFVSIAFEDPTKCDHHPGLLVTGLLSATNWSPVSA